LLDCADSDVSFISIISYNVQEASADGVLMTTELDPVTIPGAEKEQVEELHRLMQRAGRAHLVGRGGEPALPLPDAVYSLLLRILQNMQEGKAVSIVPFMQDLTTQEAANLLGVSRPFFVKLVEAGTLPFHMTGTHRRVYLKDLLDYKQRRDRDRLDAINRMAQIEEDAGVYDRVLIPEPE
jgi:excisionase family DNA binding protein